MRKYFVFCGCVVTFCQLSSVYYLRYFRCVSLGLVSHDVLLIRSTIIFCTIFALDSFVIVNSWSYFVSKVVISPGSRRPLVKVELEVSLAELLQEVDTSRRRLQKGNVTSVLLVMAAMPASNV